MESPVLKEFVEEVDEILQDLEQGILQLEGQPKKKSLVDRIFRNMHTIKAVSYTHLTLPTKRIV